MRGEHGADGIGRAVHEVGTGAAVNMEVDEARCDEAAPGVDHPGTRGGRRPTSHGGDDTVLADDLAVGEQAVGQDDRAVPHDQNSVPADGRGCVSRPACTPRPGIVHGSRNPRHGSRAATGQGGTSAGEPPQS
jgi:hypothetical protein